MCVLVNSWLDEARVASLAVRRSKRQERGRQDMMERKRKEWQAKRDLERWLKENPGKTEADWQDRDKARVAARKKSKEDEEKALLEKHKARFDRQATGPRSKGEFFVENWIPRDDDGLGFPSIIDPETGEAIELPPDMLEPEYDPRTGEFYRPPAVLKDPH